ncbi:uncharacterized protein LTR77_009429 [Saxophila tyrrhenica]|uniref:CMP/dCMP-type deaminase domain-containing protein n=1 Tax=Saxophila tyrrhenica TaxID=1690608 RepID=A0AAV9NXM0_9PEZI|nr:hypothetical protein LTR77_009429 [Saxophila tyrrhenica]
MAPSLLTEDNLRCHTSGGNATSTPDLAREAKALIHREAAQAADSHHYLTLHGTLESCTYPCQKCIAAAGQALQSGNLLAGIQPAGPTGLQPIETFSIPSHIEDPWSFHSSTQQSRAAVGYGSHQSSQARANAAAAGVREAELAGRAATDAGAEKSFDTKSEEEADGSHQGSPRVGPVAAGQPTAARASSKTAREGKGVTQSVL